MANTVRHPAPRQRSVRHRSARALTPARRETGRGEGRRGGTEETGQRAGEDGGHPDQRGEALTLLPTDPSAPCRQACGRRGIAHLPRARRRSGCRWRRGRGRGTTTGL